MEERTTVAEERDDAKGASHTVLKDFEQYRENPH